MSLPDSLVLTYLALVCKSKDETEKINLNLKWKLHPRDLKDSMARI